MSLLPDYLVALGPDGAPLRESRFQRIHPRSEEARQLYEADWNEIICANTESIADAMRAGGVIQEDSTLRLLGRQIENVDVLFMEVPAREDGSDTGLPDVEPRRLVLLEDKLLRNRQAKREVLAQLYDYAQRDWTTELLCRAPTISQPLIPWLKRYARTIDAMLAQQEFLLVIAGDDIDDNLLRLARRFARAADPLSLAELCLISLSMYQRGNERLLIPHVVSSVERHERQLSIRVTVTGEAGETVPARIERDTETEAEERGSRPLPTNPVLARRSCALQGAFRRLRQGSVVADPRRDLRRVTGRARRMEAPHRSSRRTRAVA
jgi:hypothetical protein